VQATIERNIVNISDPAQRARPSLDAFFQPRSVAVIGASERPSSVGRAVMENLCCGGFKGAIYPINPARSTVLGIQAWKDIEAVPGPVDLAVIATPAATVPGIVGQCAAVGVQAAIILSAGFNECGAAGAALERELIAAARGGRAPMRVIGPNCLGVAVPSHALNATFAPFVPLAGKTAFISQSGALCSAILDWSRCEGLGFSAFVSVGGMVDVGWGDLIDYFGEDPKTKAIAIYMESIGDARSFLSAAREVAMTKPIIVIKAGATDAGAKAAASHTGAMTGSDAVLDAALRRAGVLRVRTIAELFEMVQVLDQQPLPNGPALTIVTNAGGPGVLATDALIACGGTLAKLAPATLAELDAILPAFASRGNPVDILGDAGPTRFSKVVQLVGSDPATDGVLVVLTPQSMTNPTATAELLGQSAKALKKPILASWMGGTAVAAGRDLLHQAGIPVFDFPDAAARVFQNMWNYRLNLRNLYEAVPESPAGRADGHVDACSTSERIASLRQAGKTLLSEHDSKRLLGEYDIPCVRTSLAHSEDEAVQAARDIGYPVVMKVSSETISHKANAGGVQLNLADEAAVRGAYQRIQAAIRSASKQDQPSAVTVQPMISSEGVECILGCSVDPQFGPVVMFGTGGSFVEAWHDVAFGLPPFNPALARQLMQRTRIYGVLTSAKNRDRIDIGRLEQLICRFSQLVVEQKWLQQLEINPILVGPTQIIALDARAVLYSRDVGEAALVKPAIRPYPSQYTWPSTLEDGSAVVIRPIRPDDERRIARFLSSLSEETLRERYGSAMKRDERIAHDRLVHLCFIDYDRQLSLVADRTDDATGEREIIGVGQLIKDGCGAEFALLVADRWQCHGLEARLLRAVIEAARGERIGQLFGQIFVENHSVVNACRQLGFNLRQDRIQERDGNCVATMMLLATAC
jgi:acetyltransferase